MSDNFWSRVLELIEWKGISRKEFSHNVGVSYSSIHNGAERGSIPSADLALKIADELNTSIEFLVYGNQKNNSNKNLKPANASEKNYHIKNQEIFLYRKNKDIIEVLETLPSPLRQSIRDMILKLKNHIK